MNPGFSGGRLGEPEGGKVAEGFGVAAWLNGPRYGGEGVGVEMSGGEGGVKVGRVAQLE